MHRNGIEVNNSCSAVHLQPFYRRRFGFRPGIFPITEAVSDRILALPFHNHLRAAAAERVVKQLSSAIASVSRRQQNARAGKQRGSVRDAGSSPGELTGADHASDETIKGTGGAC